MKLPRLLVTVCLALVSLTVSAQQNWRWVNTLPATTEWNDIAFGNGTYVIVGLDATIATSTDGATWTVRRMGTSGMNLNGVAYGNGLFVAVGGGTPTKISGGLVMTSPNGIDWTINQTVADTTNAQYQDVLYGNNTFLITGSSSGFLASTDGLTWTGRPAPGGVFTGNGTFGGGRFVLSGNGNSVVVSTDGVTWTRTAVAGAIGASSPFIEDVTYGGGKYVAIGRDNNFNGVAYTSTDAATWTASSIANSSSGLSRVVSDGTKFSAVGNAGLFSSPDGTTWTKQTLPIPQTARQLGPITEPGLVVVQANNLFFLIGGYGSISTSPDGVAWTRRSTGVTNDLIGLMHDGTKFIATGAGGTALTSADGTTWTQVTTGTTSTLGRMAYNGTRYATADYSGILHSANLTSWTQVSGTSFDRFYGVVYGAGKFVAAYDATSLGVRTSADGITWAAANTISGAGGNTNGLVFGNNTFVLTMAGFGTTRSKIYSSTNGTAWTERTPTEIAAGIGIESLAYGNGRFVILMGDRRSFTSTDGITWTVNSLPSSFSLQKVAFVGSQFVARSSLYGAQSYVSADGVTWTALENSSAPANSADTMVANGSVVVAISYAGGIMRGDVAGAAQPQTLAATVPAGATVQWVRNGSPISGATSASYTLASVQPADAAVYSALVTNGSTTIPQAFIVGVSSTAKVLGTGSEVGANIVHPQTGFTYDQVLLQGAAATITADSSQITRMSFIDLNNDIVQVEFSGAGTVSLVLDGSSGPAAPASYNQSTVSYMKGHAGIVVVGANETSNLSVFSVGRGNAVNQALFRDDVTYDGVADLAFIAIASTNGKFGGLRTSNASYFATRGVTGVYAPGVQFQGPVFVGDVNAQDSALPVLIIGSSPDTRITGGDMQQANGRAIEVAGLTQLKFTAGTTSHSVPQAAQANKGRFETNGTDVTGTIVVNP